jgi:hypothetical protein
MSRFTIFVVLIISPFFCGCSSQQSTLQKVYALDRTFTSTVAAMTPLIEQHQILVNANDRQWYKLTTHKISDMLDDAETKALAGDKITAESLLPQIESLVNQIVALQRRSQLPSTRPSTNPTTFQGGQFYRKESPWNSPPYSRSYRVPSLPPMVSPTLLPVWRTVNNPHRKILPC